MDFDWDSGEEAEDTPEIEDDSQEVQKPTYILLAIDVAPSMFLVNDSNGSAFLQCIKGLQYIMNVMIMKDSKSLRSPLGVVLATDYEDTFHLIKFTDNMVDNFRLIQELVSQGEDNLMKKYSRLAPLDFAQFLLRCQKCLIDINADVYKRQIVFVTNDDSPTIADDVKFRTLNIAKNFVNHNMYLEITTYNPNFDYDVFYKEVLLEAKSKILRQYLEDYTSFALKVDDLLIGRLLKYKTKFYPVKNDLGQCLDLFQINYVKDAFVRNNFFVRSDNGEPVMKIKEIEEGSGTDLFKAHYTRNDFVQVNAFEKASIIETDLPCGYHFLYTSARFSQYGHFLEHPTFVAANDNMPNQQSFLPFWQYCYDNNKVLVCARKYRCGSPIRYVELIPKIIDKIRMFMVVVIATSEDRNYEHYYQMKAKESSEKGVAAMKKLVDKMTVDYNPEDFYCLSLRKKIAYIRSGITDEGMLSVQDIRWKKIFTDLEESDKVEEVIGGGHKRIQDDEFNWVTDNISGYTGPPEETLVTKKRIYKKK